MIAVMGNCSGIIPCRCGATGCPDVCDSIGVLKVYGGPIPKVDEETDESKFKKLIEIKKNKKQWGEVNQWRKGKRFK